MYRIAIVRKGQDAERRTCTEEADLRNAVYNLIQSEGSRVTDADRAAITAMVSNARAIADREGFAALEFGATAITIRPADALLPCGKCGHPVHRGPCHRSLPWSPDA